MKDVAWNMSPKEFLLTAFWIGKLGLKAFLKVLSVMFELTDWGRLEPVFQRTFAS